MPVSLYQKSLVQQEATNNEIEDFSPSGKIKTVQEKIRIDLNKTVLGKPLQTISSDNPFKKDKLPRKGCDPVQKVIFAKTHKTGSSTVQNVLLRYGVSNDRLFAMPPKSWMFKLTEDLNSSIVLDGPWKDLGNFDIFAFHCRWDVDEVFKIVPDAKLFTILREPISNFESNYVFMGAQSARSLNINEFAEKVVSRGDKRGENAYVGQNNLLWDLGLRPKVIDDPKFIDAKIKEVEDRFDLVLFMERFEESMVLLADLMCWPLEDVMYIKQNARKDEYKKTRPNQKTKEIMRKWLEGDYKVC